MSPVGQLVPIDGHDEQGKEFSYFAFLPDPLPTEINLSPATWTKVAEASEALGRLHQACAPLPNPGLLIAPALAKEAVDTSALTEPRGVVGFEVILGAYSPASMAAMSPVSLSG